MGSAQYILQWDWKKGAIDDGCFNNQLNNLWQTLKCYIEKPKLNTEQKPNTFQQTQ